MWSRIERWRRRKPTGACDGVDGVELHGWAWRPGDPQARVEVEQWVEGELVGRTVADLFRADLAQAGLGDGRHGWRMPLALDPAKAEPQRVEVRVRGGGVLPNGDLRLRRDEMIEAPAVGEPHGVCDGREGAQVCGWAWRPQVPEQRVEIEQWVDGMLAARSVADLFRADLADAGVGDGRYGWTMRLALDPAKATPQKVELRIRGGGLLEGGRFEVAREELEDVVASLNDAPASAAGVEGRCDGLKGSALHGWAWDPSRPDQPVEVELWVDGARVAGALAADFRPDLRASRIGAGRHGWRLPVDFALAQGGRLKVEVRSKGGPPLRDGVLELRDDLSLDDPANADLRPFIAAMIDPSAEAHRPPRAFLLHCPEPRERGDHWAREYDDYRGVMSRFAAALAGHGQVLVVDDLDDDADALRAAHEDGVLFSFGPPRLAPLAANRTVVPVFAWAFPTLPTGTWDGDPRSDWRHALRACGRAVVLSRFGLETVRAAMGTEIAAAAVAPPVEVVAGGAAPLARRAVDLAGAIFDSAEHVLRPEHANLPPPVWSGSPTEGLETRTIEVEGVLFAACLDIDDGRKNWADLVSAFVIASRERPDAVLLLKLAEPAASWMQTLYNLLARLPSFQCRVLAMRGDLDEAAWRRLVAASHWYASAAGAEGLCLPMLEFMAQGRPVIAPDHTAFADHVDTACGLVVRSEEEAWSWPDGLMAAGWSWTQHPDDVGPTTQNRVSWTGLVAAFEEGYRLARQEPDAYGRLGEAAREHVRTNCSPAGAWSALEALLEGDGRFVLSASGPSRLLRDLAAG